MKCASWWINSPIWFIRGEDAGHLMPLVQQHLDLCAECREEYEALLRVLEALDV